MFKTSSQVDDDEEDFMYELESKSLIPIPGSEIERQMRMDQMIMFGLCCCCFHSPRGARLCFVIFLLIAFTLLTSLISVWPRRPIVRFVPELVVTNDLVLDTSSKLSLDVLVNVSLYNSNTITFLLTNMRIEASIGQEVLGVKDVGPYSISAHGEERIKVPMRLRAPAHSPAVRRMVAVCSGIDVEPTEEKVNNSTAVFAIKFRVQLEGGALVVRNLVFPFTTETWLVPCPPPSPTVVPLLILPIGHV